MDRTGINTAPIDAVVTWVDGNDPEHIQKRQAAMKQSSITEITPIAAGRDSTRFINNGEIQYCLTSIRKFAPWIRYIHLVTDNQIPDFLSDTTFDAQGIKLVDHKTIFRDYEWALPTFNSITIETALWRIPDLADRFLYLNDDFFIIKPVQPEDFFSGEKVILRGQWKRLEKFGPARVNLSRFINYLAKKIFNINRALSLLQQMRAAELAGMKQRFYKAPHVPHPVHTTTLYNYFTQNPELFERNIRFPFRDASQFVSIFLADHLEIIKENCILTPDSDDLMICFNRDSPETIKNKTLQLESENIKFLCLQSFEQASDREKRFFIDFLDKTISCSTDLKIL